MKITRRRLSEIIEQEVRARLLEKGDKPKKSGKKKDAPKKPTTAAADSDVDLQPQPGGGGPDPIQSAPPIDGGMNDSDGDGLPDDQETEDPTDGQGDDDAEAIDAHGTAGEEPSGAVNTEVSGKTVQAVSIEPESPNLPGAKEVVISFAETQDTLRIILSPTGQVKFGWPCDSTGKAKQIHDLP